MIKKFFEFLNDKSLGELVESLYDDDYIKNIVNRYIGDISPDIDLVNAINILDDRTKNEIKSQIDKYQSYGIEDKDVEMIASTEINENVIEQPIEVQSEISVAGKSIFTSFLKSLTALGQKERQPNLEKCPSQFLLFYFYDNLYANDVKSIFSRFKSLNRFTNLIDYGKNETSLYFGIKCDGTIEYGVAYERLHKMGGFKLSASSIKWIVQIDSKSASSLKKQIVNLSYQDILLLGKIKTDMKQYNPGYNEKVQRPIINDKVMTFGYYGVGNWSNGKIDETDLLRIKNEFSVFVGKHKWANKVLISVKPQSFWLYLNIKIK